MTFRHRTTGTSSRVQRSFGPLQATCLGLLLAMLNMTSSAVFANSTKDPAKDPTKSPANSPVALQSKASPKEKLPAVSGSAQKEKPSAGAAGANAPGLADDSFDSDEMGETKSALLGAFCPEFPGLDCGNPDSGACTEIHGIPGCTDCECCAIVCTTDPLCCSVTWDAFCVAVAFAECATCGSPVAGGCCSPKISPGCDDASCCSIVCSVRPICCEVSWDIVCAQLAAVVCPRCASCNDPAAGNCFAPHGGTGCEERVCCVFVCGGDPYCCDIEWDSTCAAEALSLCTGYSACVNLGPGFSCFLTHDEPGCSTPGCCEVVCASVPDCCNVAWDQSCVDTASILCVCSGLLGGSCVTPHEGPGCGFQPCCDQVCSLDVSCCETDWDADCADLAASVCCGLPGSGTCYRANGTPFCDDQACCFTICELDFFCCSDTWDELCADAAKENCLQACFDYSGSRECYLPHGGPGCEQASICTQVCELDPLCCTAGWDASCVQFANALFSSGGCPGNGGCYDVHPGAGCGNELCCKLVCEIDVSCCTNAWDASCASFAVIVCDPIGSVWAFPPICPAESGNCFTPTVTPGCTVDACCLGICGLDVSCCEVAWDTQCVTLAQQQCQPTSPFADSSGLLSELCIPSIHSCLSVHDDPYCIDAECSSAVCIVDKACCDVTWDQICVNLAVQLCARSCGGLLSGNCFLVNGRPGCSDWDCCERICNIDQFCCQVVWDSGCVDAAELLCLPKACLIDHSVPVSVPGCDDPLIAAAVCSIEPTCCTQVWDVICAEIAQTAVLMPPACDPKIGGCSGGGCVPSCGSDDAGNCFLPNFVSPNCDDAACCTTVCEEDCFCCTALWDFVCADTAKELCSTTWLDIVPDAGDICAGSCFLVKPTPFCNDEECSMLVCDDDPVCCELSWDLFCVESALFYCLECGDADAGNCCGLHPAPYCNDQDCCEAVCALDAFCCSLGGQWDDNCVTNAETLCRDLCPTPEFLCGAVFAGDCCFAHNNPFCNDQSCCVQVCNVDSFCCDVNWDAACATIALENCPECSQDLPQCGDFDAGSCFVVHPTPACDDFECCSFVCAFFDAFCCDQSWDADCANTASTFCP